VNMAVAAPFIMRDYGWSLARMGWVLSLFYVGYVAFMIPAGILADRWGPKRVFAWGVAWWSLFTYTDPVSALVVAYGPCARPARHGRECDRSLDQRHALPLVPA